MGPLVLLLLAAAPTAFAPKTEARQLECVSGRRQMKLTTLRCAEDAATCVQAQSTDGPPDSPKPGGPKPPAGCPFTPPLPSADWRAQWTVEWTARGDGTFTAANGQKASWTCKERTVSAMDAPTSFALKRGMECAAGGNAFELRGGTRVEVPVTECTFRRIDARAGPNAAPLVFTFSQGPDRVERVVGVTDCYSGFDYRLVRAGDGSTEPPRP